MKRSPSGPYSHPHHHQTDNPGPSRCKQQQQQQQQAGATPKTHKQQPSSPTWPGQRSQSFTQDPNQAVVGPERVNLRENPLDNENNITSPNVEVNSNEPRGKEMGVARPKNLKPKTSHRKGEREYRGQKEFIDDGTASLPMENSDKGHRGKAERSQRDHRRHRHRRHPQARKEQQDNVVNELHEKNQNRLSAGTSSSDTLPRIPEDKLRPLPCATPENVPARAPTEGAENPQPVNNRLNLNQPANGHEDSSDQSETRIHNGQKSQSSDSDIGVCGLSHRSIEV